MQICERVNIFCIIDILCIHDECGTVREQRDIAYLEATEDKEKTHFIARCRCRCVCSATIIVINIITIVTLPLLLLPYTLLIIITMKKKTKQQRRRRKNEYKKIYAKVIYIQNIFGK